MPAIVDTLYLSNRTVYAHIRNKSGEVWNGSSFESYSAGNWTTYDVALTEDTSSGYYKASFPSAISAGFYRVIFYRQSGATPAAGDEPIGSGTIEWDGSNEVSWATDSLSELSSGAPASTPTPQAALMLLYMALRNKRTTDKTNALIKIFNDAGTEISRATISDDGSVATKGEFGSP